MTTIARTRGAAALLLAATALPAPAAADATDLADKKAREEMKKFEFYHPFKLDPQGRLLPWYSADHGKAFDHVVRLVFRWWRAIEKDPRDPQELPYHMLHQVWRPGPHYDARGIGGDQVAMALSSWALLYQYGGDPAVIEDMRQMADLTLALGSTKPTDDWPHIPYPYNTRRHVAAFDGQMRAGPGYIEPDKAGALAYELVVLWKITGDRKYLDAAVRIADVLARKTREGDGEVSPLPYRVRARDGAVGAAYTSNWVWTLRLFEELQALGRGKAPAYRRAHDLLTRWLKEYPLRTNKWGPFFEDIPTTVWSDTQHNAGTLALYIMERREAWGPRWKEDARSCLDWAWKVLGNEKWKHLGVVVMNEQTAYRVPGNSHTARQASMELRYAELTGDTSRKENAVRALAWATYSVDHDGKNRYYNDDIWLTDGYGDYVRHFLRAMAAAPELAPSDQDHVLRSSSVVKAVTYAREQITYRTFDAASEELVKVTTFVPAAVTAGGASLPRHDSAPALAAAAEGWAYDQATRLLRVKHRRSADVKIGATTLSQR